MISTDVPERQRAPMYDNMGQEWKKAFNSEHYYYDQYGFKIIPKNGVYCLYWKERPVFATFGIPAAKLIANILLNDYIENKP
jgi:hypothetical protein